MKVEYSRVVNCPQAVAFEYYADRDADMEWWSGTVSTRLVSEVQHGIGVINRQRQKFPPLPFTFEVDLEVVEWCPPERWREVARNGPAQQDVWYTVEKIDENTTRVGLHGYLHMQGWLKLFEPILRPIVNRLAERNYDRLKSALDALGAAATS